MTGPEDHGRTFFGRTILDSRYEIIEEVGRGTFGSVYRARDLHLHGSEVAVKVLHLHQMANERALRRLRDEVALTRRFCHGNIVRTYEFSGLGSDSCYLTMELINGPHLADLRGLQPFARFDLCDALRLLREIAAGVAHAHDCGVVHRDLKPQNVLVSEEGVAKVTDFSVARAIAEGDRGLTRTGELIGTAYYMAPEQFRSSAADGRSDIYSWGIIAFECISGRRPFEQATFFALARCHAAEPVPRLSGLHREVPAWLEHLVTSCLEKDPRNRPGSFDEVIRALGERAEEIAVGAAVMTGWRTAEIRRKRRVIGKRCAAVLLALTALLITVRAAAEMYPEQAFRVGASAQRLLPSWIAWPVRLTLGMPPFTPDNVLLWKLMSADSLTDSAEHAVRGLIRAGTDFSPLDDGATPMVVRATELDSPGVLHDLDWRHADLSWRGKEGESLLHYAMLRHAWRAALMLLELRPDWNVRDNLGRTPLHVAAGSERPAIATALSSGKSFEHHFPPMSVNAQTLNGETPIHILIEVPTPTTDVIAALRELLKHDPDLSLRDAFGRTAFFVAVFLGHRELVREMIPTIKRLDPSVLDAPDNAGTSPLLVAANAADWNLMRLLLEGGAGPCPHDKLGAGARAQLQGERKHEVRVLYDAWLREHGVRCDDEGT